MKSNIFKIGLVLLCAGCFTVAAQAQSMPNPASFTPAGPTGQAVVDVSTMPLEEISGTTLSGMSAAWWKNLSRRHTRALASPDEQTREQSMQNIIYFTTHYPGEADFDGAVQELLETYILDRNEGHRILALTALHAIGNDAAMRHLGQYVKLERSERVRRLTTAALADYYAKKAS